MTGLSPNTTYHVRAYATNTAGTAYGSDVSFTNTKGDINNDGNVDLVDAIIALKVVLGIDPDGVRLDYETSGTDVNEDGKIRIEEVIYILQEVSGLR